MQNTKIAWATHTFNPWEGCTKVSPGCAHCYAATRNARFGGGTAPNWGPGAPRRRTSAANWREPLRWHRQAVAAEAEHHAAQLARPFAAPRVFCASLADWLDHEVPAAWLADLLELIAATPALDWLLLTKRPHRWLSAISTAFASFPDRTSRGAALAELWLSGIPPQNVWLGTTTEDQARAADRIPALLSIPARVRFLSCEPLLGPLDLTPYLVTPTSSARSAVDWVIAGGESGPGARPMHPTWPRSLLEQCTAAAVPFFFKQWGEWLPEHQEGASRARKGALIRGVHTWPDGSKSYQVGKVCAGHLLDGLEIQQFPTP